METIKTLYFTRRKIMAPCQKDGRVNSNNIQFGDYEDSEDKIARCVCSVGDCCVDGGNYVIEGPAFNLKEENK